MLKAEQIAAGFERMDLVAEMKEGVKGMEEMEQTSAANDKSNQWRFIGICSKNCQEWTLSSMASMYRKVTLVGLQDNLG